MIITLNRSSGVDPEVVLVDDLGTTTDGFRITGFISDFGGQSLADVVPIYGAANPGLFARGNVQGRFAFSATASHASLAAMLEFFQKRYALLNSKEKIVLKRDDTVLIMNNALCVGVQRGPSSNGLRLEIQYTFIITTLLLNAE
jgi:hypothetical protein